MKELSWQRETGIPSPPSLHIKDRLWWKKNPCYTNMGETGAMEMTYEGSGVPVLLPFWVNALASAYELTPILWSTFPFLNNFLFLFLSWGTRAQKLQVLWDSDGCNTWGVSTHSLLAARCLASNCCLTSAFGPFGSYLKQLLHFHSPLHIQDGSSLHPLPSLQGARIANNFPLFMPCFEPGLFHTLTSFIEMHLQKQFSV